MKKKQLTPKKNEIKNDQKKSKLTSDKTNLNLKKETKTQNSTPKNLQNLQKQEKQKQLKPQKKVNKHGISFRTTRI